MNLNWHLFTALPLGFGLGYFYFGMLWLTVRQLPSTQWPIRLFVGSFLGRLTVALIGIYLVTNGQWERALACLGGFLLARSLLIHRLQLKQLQWKSHVEESQHGN
nr:ATP synthase subunit I [Synechococcus sp. PCC 7336]